MNAIINRSALMPGGFIYEMLDGKVRPIPDNLAYVETGCGKYGREQRDVTWQDVMKARRERQGEILERIRQPSLPALLPCYVWTFFNRQDIPYHGWYCYIVTRQVSFAVNFRSYQEQLANSIMAEIPLGFLPLKENFDSWMEAFAKKYPRTHTHDPRKAGTFLGWIKDKNTFSIHKPIL